MNEPLDVPQVAALLAENAPQEDCVALMKQVGALVHGHPHAVATLALCGELGVVLASAPPTMRASLAVLIGQIIGRACNDTLALRTRVLQ